MLNRFPDQDFDKREGSVLWDILSPMAIELTLLYIQLEWMWEQMYGDTAQRDALIRLAADRGLEILPASQARVLGEFNREIPTGEKFSYESLNYIVVDFSEVKDGFYYYEMICESVGEEGNIQGVDLVPVANLRGLTHARISKILVPGEEEEDTESFRQRYHHSIKHRDYGFNASQYVHQVNMLQGVGAVRCYPAEPAPGHVMLVILDPNYRKASRELIEEVQEILDPVPYQQKGMGRAPVGHRVHVTTAEEDTIQIRLRVDVGVGKDLESYKLRIQQGFEDYFSNLRKDFEGSYNSVDKSVNLMVIRQSILESIVLDINKEDPGAIVDVKVHQLIGNLSAVDDNYPLGRDSIPVLGVIQYE